MTDLRQIFLRAAQPQDYTACRRLTNQVANREGFGFVSAVTFNDFAKRQANDPRYILRVAADSDCNIVGYVRALALSNGQQITIHEICRDVAWKGQGVGSRLLADVEAIARQKNIPKLFLKTPAGIRAHAAYQRFGFVALGTEPRPPKADGRPSRSLVHFEKRLER